MALSTKEEYIAQCMASESKTREECEHEWNQTQTQQQITDQETKEEYMAQCVASGKTEVECEAAWKESHPPAADFASLARKYAILKERYDENLLYLGQATKIIKHFQAEKDARDLAEKHGVAVEIEAKTAGRLKYKELMTESPRDLDTMRRAIDKATPKNFTNVSAILAASDARKKPKGTVGEWDPIAKKWKGGI